MITYYEIKENRVIQSTRDNASVIVASTIQDNEKEEIKNKYCLDEYDMNSIFDPDEVPRIDFSDERLLLIWKSPIKATVSESIEFEIKVTGLILFRDQLMFVGETSEISFMEREFRKTRDVRDVLLAFLLSKVRQFVGHLKAIRMIGAELEKKITVSMENKHLLQMFSLSESLVYYVDALEGNGVVLRKLDRMANQLGFQEQHLEMLEDIILENSQAARQANIHSSVLSGLMDARGSIVNNNMNVLLKNLTLINIVFLPLNLVASIGGMSEWSMMTKGIDWRISYALFCFAMVALGWCTWIFTKKIVDRPRNK
ncbi:MAG: magnesium transporter CorA family protein [Deltaproteobacteria bacterium]|nr:magnesium transporter CorA family protein [Deltaproteobacteria bacterium]